MKPIGFKVIENEAYLNNYKLSDLAHQFGTPLYVMDEKQLIFAIEEYQNYFKGNNFNSVVVYASKAFMTPYICNLIDKYDFYMDSVSIGDLYVARKSGFNMEHIVFHGNNKSTEELEYALNYGVGIIVVDNYFELVELNKIANDKGIKQDILIRVNPGIDAHTHKYIQTAKLSSKFGESIYDKEIIDKLMNFIKMSDNINLLGFHAHIGSQIHESEAFISEIDKMVEFQMDIASKYNLHLSTLNLGGGFGIKYTKEEKNISIKDMMTIVSNYLDKVLMNNSMIKTVMIEPGRSIVGPAGITLYSCSQIKKTFGGKNYLFIDGGMTDNIRPALYDAIYECDIVNKMNQRKEIMVDVVGKACESGDIIRENVESVLVENGDILVVYATGAYNYSMSSNYNNHLKPAVIVVGDDIKVISRRETLEDLCRFFK